MVPLLVNPRSGRGRAAAAVARVAARPEFETRPAATPEALADQARRAAAEGHERIVVAGGDGTVHHALRGLAGTGCALGILPAGTGNDLARALDLDLDVDRAADRALAGRPTAIDLGRVGGLPYAGVAAAGFDGEVLRFLRERVRRPAGPGIYAYAVLRTLLAYVPPQLSIEFEGGRFDGRAMLVGVANSPLFGGGMRIAPLASLTDGELDLIVVREMPRLRMAAVFPRVYRGSHLSHPAVQYTRVRSVRMRSRSPLTIHGDGEPLAGLGDEAVEITVEPRGLHVVT